MITNKSISCLTCFFSPTKVNEVDASTKRLDEYNDLIIKYMNARFNDGVVMAVCHTDENGGLPHLHLDILPITEDCRLSAKTLITRDFITSMHKVMPLILQRNGFDIDDYEETEEKRQGGLSAKEYNNLADRYNKLVVDKSELERKNKEKAYEVINQQEHIR